MSRLLDRLAAAYFAQGLVGRGKDRVGRRLRPHLGEIRCRTSSGLLFDADPVDLIQYSILLTGEWEPEETTVLRHELLPGSVFYDVGANAGYFTLLAAQLVGASGHVYAFEPNQAILPKLRSNIALNHLRNVTVVPVALADSEGQATFNSVGGANSGMSSLRADEAPGASVEVDLVRLDRLIEQNELRPPDVIKMDIEGAELLALRGMTATMRSSDRLSLLIEVSDRFLRQMGGSEEELLELLDRLGLDLDAEVSRHPAVEPDGRPFQYTALFRRQPVEGTDVRRAGKVSLDIDPDG